MESKMPVILNAAKKWASGSVRAEGGTEERPQIARRTQMESKMLVILSAAKNPTGCSHAGKMLDSELRSE
jgi:hypothetical protein